MQFLRTLFWVLVAVLVALFASRNWFDVTLSLWGDIRADVKVPVLLAFVFLLGLLPPLLLYRARLWALRRRLEAAQLRPANPVPTVQPPAADPVE